ncbi:hypothetical protein BJX99DRAFT_259405 [Aspergillus californicus]
MVRLGPAISLAAFISLSIAAPSAILNSSGVEARDAGFSFEAWANGIIADPEGFTKRDDMVKRDDVSCNDKGKPKASLADAVSCINQLAARGNANCHIPYAGGAALSTVGLAQIYGVTVNKAGSILPCQTFAASAGRILDLCVHAGDTTVQGSNHPNGNIQIHLSRP